MIRLYLYVNEFLKVIMWLVISLIFFMIELNRKEIFFIYFSISSLLSSVLSLFVNDIGNQIVFFIISSIIFIIFVKTILDKMIEINIRFKHSPKFNEDKLCLILREEKKDESLYKVISKSGIYTAKFINCGRNALKFKVCNIIHDDGELIIIR